MKFLNIKNRDLAVALKAFFITLCCFAVLFLIIAAVTPKRAKNRPQAEDETAVSANGNAVITVLYENADKTEFVKLEFNFQAAEYSCSDIPDYKVTLGDTSMRLSEFLKARGISGFSEAYTEFSGSAPAGYIRFTPETLEQAVNRFGGINGEGGSRITGAQAVKLAENGGLCDVIRKSADRFFSPFGSLSLKNRFLYLVSVTDTDLSYAEFYSCREQLERLRKIPNNG